MLMPGKEKEKKKAGAASAGLDSGVLIVWYHHHPGMEQRIERCRGYSFDRERGARLPGD